MYCYRCGQRLAESARHCPNCGAAIFYNEDGPVKGAAGEDCDACSQDGFGSAYSTHDPYKTTTDESAYGTESHYRYDPQTGSYHYNPDGGFSKDQNSYGPDFQKAGGSPYSYGNASAPGQAPYPPYRPAYTKQDGYALGALICAIVSLCCCCVPYVGLAISLGAIVLGIMGLKAPQRKTMAVVGIVLGGLMLVLNGVMLASSLYYAAHPEFMEEWMHQLEELMPELAESSVFPVN